MSIRAHAVDALRERLASLPQQEGMATSSVSACNGDRRRAPDCFLLTLAVMQEGPRITTIEGLGAPGTASSIRRLS